MHIQNVHIHVGSSAGSALTAAALASLMSFDPSPSDKVRTGPAPDTLTAPRIGEYWKGQGGIYVGVGRGYDGMPDHRLILPTDPKAIFKKRALGTYGIDVTGATSDHDGMANTIALAEAGSEICKEIRALEIEGHADLYLMSRTDARLCMANAPEQFEKEWYLTSTQYSANGAWTQYFYDGGQDDGIKKFEALFRPVRRYKLFVFRTGPGLSRDCRQHKRNTASALAFEAQLEWNLCALYDELASGDYRPGRSICFVITRPKPREVWAADFRDRIVHHLLYNHVAARFHAGFVAGSSACIPGRGTLYAARRLEADVRSITQNWKRPAHYLKCDLANFFVAIPKCVLHDQLAVRIHEPWWLWLSDVILFHDPRENVELRGRAELLAKVPPHKSLFNAPPDTGLPIGNLSSQFFANVHLDTLDQFCKHQIGARHYVRYVDDFILLHESPQWLNAAHDRIRDFLPARLGAHLNPTKTILQRVERGIDFVGHIVKPWRRTTRPRTLRNGIERLRWMPASDVFQCGNSYLGLVRQASHSHHEQAQLCRVLLQRGHAVAGDLGKIFRSQHG